MQYDQQQSSSRLGTAEEQDPQLAYLPFVAMEDLLDKLKILNYDDEFSKAMKMRPLSRHYFAIQTNPGEQFYMFTSLAAWLVRKMGRRFEQPQEFDDPNSVIASILDATRELGIAVDFPPNKLKQGFGHHALLILCGLADKALELSKYEWEKPCPPPELETEDVVEEDDSELLLERIEEEMAAEESSEDEDNLLNIDDLHNLPNRHFVESQKPEDVMESNINSEDWRMELERVLPLLKVTIKTDGRDWRSHLDQMKQHRSGMEESVVATKTQLDKLGREISATMDKVTSREKFLNSQLEPLLVQYRVVQDELAKVSEQYREKSGGVAERQRELNRITDELEAVKQEIEERGASMTDGSPLVNIKKAIAVLKRDICEMNVRMGVLDHSLLQARLRDKSLLQKDTDTLLAV